MWPKVFALDIRNMKLPAHAQKTLENILGFIQEVGWQYQLLSRNWSVCEGYTPTFWQFARKHDFLFVRSCQCSLLAVKLESIGVTSEHAHFWLCYAVSLHEKFPTFLLTVVPSHTGSTSPPYQHYLTNKNIYLHLEKSGSNQRAYQWIMFKRMIKLDESPCWLAVFRLQQRFSNFSQVGTTFISQNVLRTTLLLGLSNSLGLP